MSVQIGQTLESDFRNPIGLLTDCHRRIEKFLRVLLTLSRQTSGGKLNSDQLAALEVALRYFREAAPLHTLDEEDSLFPRMRDKANDDNAAALGLLDALHVQHISADDCHHRVDELGRKWLNQGELSPQDARSFNDLLEELSGTYSEHIAIEERDVFSLATEMFDDVELETIANEMALRRGLTLQGNAVTRFKDLLALHRQLDELFLDHQRMLLRLDLDRALMLLDDYEATLLAHIRDEEEFVIPLYREKVAAPVGGAAEIFLGEHEKLRQFLVLFREELSKIRKMKDTERGVLFLIDSQHLFKRLLVHHDTREKKMLYPLLDEVTTEEDRRELFARLQLPPYSKIDSVLVKPK